MAGFTYELKIPQLEKAMYHGMTLDEKGVISSDSQEFSHYVVFPVIDSGLEDCPWGRLKLKLSASSNSVFYIYAAAAADTVGHEMLYDPSISFEEKKKHLVGMKALRFVNKKDVLLYEIEGRYLYFIVEILGDSASFKDVVINVPGDNFMGAFPEVYREKNSFFHRYLSIFSSIHNDFQDQLDSRQDLLDIDKASKKCLEIYLKWLGIDVDGGFLDEEDLRTLLKETPELLKYKGTRKSIERLCELFVGEKPTILERGLMQGYVATDEQNLYDNLYGDSPYDVTLMMNAVVEEHKKEQLLHLLKQFKPIRCKLHILFLMDRGIQDEHTYLDLNAVIFSTQQGNMDESTLTDGAIVLE